MLGRILLLLDFVALASNAIADDTMSALTVGTNTYRHVVIFKVSATDIYFTSDEGLANVKLKDLDPAVQAQFNYNATNAAAVESRQKAENDLYHIEITKPSVVAPPADMAAAVVPGGTTEPGTGKLIWAKPLLNQPAPPLIVEKWLNSQPNHRGKFVLIDFWATWCPPCRAAIPPLNALQQEFAGQLIVVGLTDEPEDTVRKMTDPVIGFTVAIDTQARTRKTVGVTGIPHVLIVDPQGIVRWEGYPFLKGYELTDVVVADIIAKYSN